MDWNGHLCGVDVFAQLGITIVGFTTMAKGLVMVHAGRAKRALQYWRISNE